MKLNDIRKFIKETIPEIIDCSIDVMKNMATEIKSAIKFIISTPKLLLNFMFNGILKPREAHKLSFKEQPLGSLFLYIYSIISKPFVFLNGKSIKESADLIDFKYTRWCIAIYLTLAGTYWFIEIGIPHWDGPKTDFQQLMTHEALVNLTVVFGASMGLIALLHRSIVSDYQIKQQNQSEIISNFYSISKHIIDNAGEIFTSTSDYFKMKPNTIASLINNIFEDSLKGNYTVSDKITNALEKISSTLFSHSINRKDYIKYEQDKSLSNIINLVDSSEKLSKKIIQTFSLSYGHLLLHPPHEVISIKHNSKEVLLLELRNISEALDIDVLTKIPENSEICRDSKLELIISNTIYETTLSIIDAIESTLRLLPIPIENHHLFLFSTKQTRELLNADLAFVKYLLESIKFKLEGPNMHYLLIFLLAAKKLNYTFFCQDDELNQMLESIDDLGHTYDFNSSCLINYIAVNNTNPMEYISSADPEDYDETAHNI